MRLRISLMALMAVVTAGTASPALAAIPNGDFADSLNGWTVIGSVEAPSGYAILREPGTGGLSRISMSCQDCSVSASDLIFSFRYRFLHAETPRSSATGTDPAYRVDSGRQRLPRHIASTARSCPYTSPVPGSV